MAGYIRQSSFSDGDTITAALFNNEYNQLLSAFSNTSGHAHDGTTAEGPVIGLIGDAGETSPNNKVLIDTTNNYIEFYVQVSSSPVQQLYIADGAIVPVTDNDIDLGTSSLEFKDAYFDGTLYADAINFNGTAITSTAAELNILDGVTSTAAELNILDGVTSTAAELNILDGVTSTAAELNILDGVTSTAAELNILDGVTASATDINLIDGITNGTVIASKAIITDSNKDITGGRNITISGELDAATLDISGDADIDGTLEADAITIAGVTLAETISDTVGAMVSSNTETNITVTYEDSDNTLDFVIGTLNQDTTGTADNITVSANNSTDETVYPIFVDGATGSQGAESDTGLTYNPSTGMLTTTGVTATFTGNITGNVTGNTSGTAATVTTAAQSNITSLGTLTTLTVDNVIINGTTIGHTSDTDLITLADGNVTIAGELDLTTLDVSGNADIDGTLEADAITVDGTALNEYIADTVGAMVSSNTETNITVTYEDGDNTLDFVIGTLNQDTTGTADNITISANNSTDETVYPIFVDGATGSQGAETDTGFTYNPSSGLLTISGELDAGSLDISGDADIDGTLEADAITIGGVTLAETIADTVGAMVTSNTESGITVAYQDADNTLDFTVGTLNQDTTGTAAIATTVTITDNESTNEENAVIFTAGGDVDGGNLGLESDGNLTYNPSSGTLTATAFAGALTGNVTGNASGTAATVTGAAQSNITSLGTLTTLTVDNVIVNGTTIGHTDDTDLMTLADGVLTVAGEVDATTLDISGNIDVDGTANLDNTDIDGTLNTSGVVTSQTSANISQVAITSSSNATAWDAAAAANAYYATSENTTFSAPSNATEGAIISVEIAQGGTARTVAWNTIFEFAASTAPTVTATASKTDIFSFRYNGSVWQEIGRVQNMAQT